MHSSFLRKSAQPVTASLVREKFLDVDQAVDRAWMGQLSRDGQVSREKRWAIQFACK